MTIPQQRRFSLVSHNPPFVVNKFLLVIQTVMEHLAGGPIQWQSGREGPLLTLSQTRRIMRDVINGLQYRQYLSQHCKVKISEIT